MSVLSINNNLPATRVANNLTDHFNKLAISTQRLSSGLRINSAADDAAGLAIRELQRADIAALRQGARNANDAISMLQTFDGALSVIDEKLIRLKELAEQAATGTYDSTQRQMIDNEFQAMKDEINRIARATDFNGIKLIDGDFETPGTEIVGDDGKTYEISLAGNFVDAWQLSDATIIGPWDKSGITNPGALIGKTNITIENNNIPKIGNNLLLVTPQGGNTDVPAGTTLNFSYDGNGNWTVNGIAAMFGNANGFFWSNNGVAITTTIANSDGTTGTMAGAATGTWTAPTTLPDFSTSKGNLKVKNKNNILTINLDLGNNNTLTQSWTLDNGEDRAVSSITISLDIKDTTPAPDQPEDSEIPDNVIKIHFGSGNDSAEDYYYINKFDATTKGLGIDDTNVQTQDNAQNALVEINDAIVEKDKIRSYYGAMQNRLENTITNIKTQAENLCVSESRISDVDVATEMTSFVRNQVLTQSAVAMLGQANMMPQIVMRLING